VELLLSKGADVNAKSASGKTPLFNAMQKDTAELLLGSGAEVNARDGSGCTPLFEAASEGCLDIVELFLSKGADVNVRSNSGDAVVPGITQQRHCRTASESGR